MIQIENLELGHHNDTLSCDYCVSPSPKNLVFGFFRLVLGLGSNLGSLGLVGKGDWDFDLGLTIEAGNCKSPHGKCANEFE